MMNQHMNKGMTLNLILFLNSSGFLQMYKQFITCNVGPGQNLFRITESGCYILALRESDLPFQPGRHPDQGIACLYSNEDC